MEGSQRPSGGQGSLFLYQRPYTQSDLLCLPHTCWQRQPRSPSCLLLVAHWTALPEQQPARTPPAALGPSSRQKVLEQLGLEQRRDTLQWSPGMQGLQAGQLHAESCPAQAPEVGSRLADTPGHGSRELLKAQQGVWACNWTGWGGVRGTNPGQGLSSRPDSADQGKVLASSSCQDSILSALDGLLLAPNQGCTDLLQWLSQTPHSECPTCTLPPLLLIPDPLSHVGHWQFLSLGGRGCMEQSRGFPLPDFLLPLGILA